MSKDNLVWKLVDKEGYFRESVYNKSFYDHYFINDIVTLSEIRADGCGLVGDDEDVIAEEEFKYFEPVEYTEVPPLKECVQLWDGITPLREGMIIGVDTCGDKRFNVILIKGSQVLVTAVFGDGMLSLVSLGYINSLIISPKEQFCDLMLNKVRSQSLDFAYDTSWDIKELSKWCYEELKERK